MKNTFVLLTLGALLAGPAVAQQPGSTTTPPNPPPGGPGGGQGHVRLTQEEQQEIHADRDAVLKADPALAAEGKDLQEKMQAYQQKLNAAMIKVDPKVAPILAKMQAAHQHHDGPGGPGGQSEPPPPGPPGQNKPPGQ